MNTKLEMDVYVFININHVHLNYKKNEFSCKLEVYTSASLIKISKRCYMYLTTMGLKQWMLLVFCDHNGNYA